MVQRTVTPRGGVNEQPPELLWLKLAREKASRGSNTTTTTMVVSIHDVTIVTNDHAWTDNDDRTTPTTSEIPHPEHPSDPSEFNKMAQKMYLNCFFCLEFASYFWVPP